MEFWQLAKSDTVGALPSCMDGYPYPRVAAPDVKRGPAPRDGMRGNSAHPCRIVGAGIEGNPALLLQG